MDLLGKEQQHAISAQGQQIKELQQQLKELKK